MALGNALSNPDNIAHLLLFQLNESIEDAKMKLLHEGKFIEMNLKTTQGNMGNVSAGNLWI